MRAVIFDWDLTLWNSWDIHLLLMAQTAGDLGVAPPAAEAIAAEFHRPFLRHLLFFLGSRPDAEEEIAAIETAYLRHYYGMAGHRNYLYPGVGSLLRMLKGQGVRIGILSDKRAEFGARELEQSGLAPLVDWADFKTEARPYKPHPGGLRRVLSKLGVEASDAVYVGDAPQDIRCARNAGAIAAAALWAAIDREALLELGPDYALHRPHQVMAALAHLAGDGGAEVWRRHLAGPWRPDGDNPADDEDARRVVLPEALSEALAEPAGALPLWRHWPLAAYWRGRNRELALPPGEANPVAPLAMTGKGG